MLSAVLLSFEGTSLEADSRSAPALPATFIAIGPSSVAYLLIFENCMVKNFHVSNMKAVRARISVRVRMQFQRKRQ
jgi:hypothetical protein